MNSPLSNVKVFVPGRSTFDKSFKNILTTKVGYITPLMCKYVMPGSKGRIRIPISAMLPPLASDTFMRADLKIEAFMVPMRLLYGGFESWLTDKRLRKDSSSSWVRAELPRLEISSYSSIQNYIKPGSLADYLGLRLNDDSSLFPTSPTYYNLFPFLAYHRVFSDWYRNPRLQYEMFCEPVDGATPTLSNLPYVSSSTIMDIPITSQFLNGDFLYSLHNRNYGDDYFTLARTSPQKGNPMSVSVTGNSFTIAALREMNSLQQFAERNSLASPRLQDYVHSHFGADLSSGVAQRAVLLGSASYPVYSKGVNAASDTTATNNPFTSVGAQYGSGMASGSDFECSFECNEPSYILVNVTLLPEAQYSSGIEHEFFLLNSAGCQVDLPDPLLENTGNEPIFQSELNGHMAGSVSGVPQTPAIFGYLPKNSWYKTSRSQVHGLLRAGESLDSFVAQRDFSSVGSVTINTAFVRCPSTALDNVTAVTADLSNYGCWIDSFIDFKVTEPLVESAMPSLQDPAYEHGREVVVNQRASL